MRSPVSMTAEEILRDFGGSGSDEFSAYLRFHARRYECLLQDIDGLLKNLKDNVRFLDIGVSTQTGILRKKLPGSIVNSMGLSDWHRTLCREQDTHFVFDLNEAGASVVKPVQHDIIIFAEVLEHLHISPKKVFLMLREWLSPGGFLLVQTPNACALHKRIAMLIGNNPFEMIRDDSSNAGHYREYTLRELIGIGEGAGFEAYSHSVRNYFTAGSAVHRVYNFACGLLPEGFREGITIIYRKTP